MADRTHDTVGPDDEELLAVSAALDGEADQPSARSSEADAFGAAAEQIRRRVRVTAAEPVPDMTEAVLARLDAEESTADLGRRVPWRAIASIAAAFVVGLAVSAAFLLDRDLDADVAAAEISRQLVQAQADLVALDAEIAIVEHGVHPTVPERTYTGTLTYESPEQLAVDITDTTAYPETADPDAPWVANDVEFVVDDEVAWRTRGLGCPVDSLPSCLGPTTVDAIVGRAPFSSGWAAPLDLVVPAGELVESDVDAAVMGDVTRITSTVREARSLVDAVLRNGAFRQVHATDTVVIDLDTATLGLRGFTISASAAPARALWATTWGYDDAPGEEVFEITIDPVAEGPAFPTTPPVSPTVDAGFRVGPVDDSLTPDELPDGLTLHRSGTQAVTTDRLDEIATWSDGRSWLAVRASPRGELTPPPAAELLSVANGIVYLDRVNGEVEVFTESTRYRLTSSLPIATVVDVAASLRVTGVGVDVDQDADVPTGALVPATVLSLDINGDEVTLVTRTDEGATVVVRERPGTQLPPPLKTDSFEIEVRGTEGRYSAALGRLTWVEAGWVVELSSTEADAAALTRLAATLRSS